MEEKIIIPEDKQVMKFSDEQREIKKETLKNLINLWKNKEYQSLKSAGTDSIKRLPSESLGEGDKELSDIYFLIASAMRELKDNPDEIKSIAIKAAHFDRLNKNAMWLIRELNHKLSETTKLFRIQVQGEIYRMYNNEEINDIFKAVYSVAADNKQEAMDYIKEFERPEITQAMTIVKAVPHGIRPELPNGVYETMKLMLWFEEGEGQDVKASSN